MAVLGLTLDKFDYELKADPDRGTDKATKFTLQALPAKVVIALKDGNSDAEHKFKDGSLTIDSIKLKGKATETLVKVLRIGLKGWTNFKKPNGEDIAFSVENGSIDGIPGTLELVPMSVINYIPSNIWEELAAAIEKGNSVAEEDEKN